MAGDDAVGGGRGGGGGKRKKVGGKKAELVELRPNSTGVWVTELELLRPSTSASMSTWAEASGIKLRQHQQFDLYKDLTGETKRLSSYISSLP